MQQIDDGDVTSLEEAYAAGIVRAMTIINIIADGIKDDHTHDKDGGTILAALYASSNTIRENCAITTVIADEIDETH